jgi:hypothetical protein
VRGREPATLDDAVRMAIRQVGKFGEGHRVGLEEAMAKQDARRTSNPRAPLGATAPPSSRDRKQPGGVGEPANLGMLGFGQLPPQKPPRYDAEGRLVSPMGGMAVGSDIAFLPPGYTNYAVPPAQQGFAVPAGYTLVPLGTGSPVGSGKSQGGGTAGNGPAESSVDRSPARTKTEE